AAAATASARGAAKEAVVLAEHALRLTPSASPERVERVLALGTYLGVAGGRDRVTDLLDPEFASLPAGEPRVRALLLMTRGRVSTNDDIRKLLDQALEESAGDQRLRASVLVEIAQNDTVIRVERIAAAEESALEALEAAGSDDDDLRRR